MNKLYKYLPFGICFKDKDSNDVFEFVSMGLNNKVIGLFKNEELVKFKSDDVLPILRPFEDLTKDLPLTKAAAEMIGMEEGILVNPLEFMFRYNNKITGYEYMNVNTIKHNDGFTINLNTETENLKIEVDIELDSNFNFSINHFVWQKKEKYRVANSYYTINLDCLDFLRALHFAVDFKKDEYIKF